MENADCYQIKKIFSYYYEGYDISDSIVTNMIKAELTTSYIINTLVIPNLDDPLIAIRDYIN